MDTCKGMFTILVWRVIVTYISSLYFNELSLVHSKWNKYGSMQHATIWMHILKHTYR